MNEYYNRSGWPATGAAGQSAPARAELALVEAGFNKLPTMTGNGNKAVLINSAGNALTVSAGTFALAVNFATAGSGAITLTSTGATNVTLPTTGTLATLAGVEELTNKTLTASVAKGTWTASGTWTIPAVTLGGTVTLNGQAFSGAASFGSTVLVTGAASLSSTLSVAGDVAVNTNKFTVAASSGNTSVAGTLAVTGAATLSSTLAVTGAATLSSTLAVTGVTTLSSNLRINGGTIGMNTAAASNAAFYLSEATAIPSSGAGAYGFRSLLLSDTSATNAQYCYEGRIYTPNSAYTLTDAVTYFANSPSKGAAMTITNWYGFRAGAANQATNNYGFYTSQSSGTGVWAFFGSSTAQSAFGGNVRIGSTVAPTVALDVTGAALISSTLGVTGATTLAVSGNGIGGAGQANVALYLKENATVPSAGASVWGVRSLLLTDTSATGNARAFEGGIYTPDAVFTLSNAIVFQASAGSKGASSTWTAWTGFYAQNNSGASTTYGFYTDMSSSGGGTKWAYFHTGTANSAINGNVRIGSTTAPTVALDVTGAALISSTLGVTGAVTLSSTLAVNGTDLTTTQTTFNLLNATATTLNVGGAANTINMGSGTGTLRLFSADVTIAAGGVMDSTSGFTLKQTGTARLTTSGTGVIVGGSVTTGSTGASAGAWKLGVAYVVSPTSPNRTIEVNVEGTIYYLHAKTTNN